MGDPLREMRAMILLSLPFPPLPCGVDRVEDMQSTGEECVITTHTLIAKCLEDAALRADVGFNQRRKQRQIEVFQRFLHAMGTRGFEAEADELYHIYCEFSLAHLHTFFEPPQALPQAQTSLLCVF
jgi:hypothetical protein